MRRVVLLLTTAGCLGLAAFFSAARQSAPAESTTATVNPKFTVEVQDKNPWTNLKPNVARDQFQFAIVSDRTGGHRKGIFSKAVQQVNLLQPEFVMSVGDLIEGARDAETNVNQWVEFDKYARQFAMPFFYCAGNHDGNNEAKQNVWKDRLGRAYYHFLYQNCLFVVMNTNDGGQKGPSVCIGKEQQAYLETVLKENTNVRWTFVFMHHPIWAARDLTENGWLECEKFLTGRKYNVFCGHVHTFRKFLRNNTAYYQLATTGGGSALRGIEYGEFDQIAWVTMKKDTPVIAQVALNGIMKDDLGAIESDEDGAVYGPVEGLEEVVGTVSLKGEPARGLQVQFIQIGAPAPVVPPTGRRTSPPGGVGVIGYDGKFKMYQNRGPSGLKPGKYAVVFAPYAGVVVQERKDDNPVPEKYRMANTTPYRVEVKPGMINKFDFKLEAE